MNQCETVAVTGSREGITAMFSSSVTNFFSGSQLSSMARKKITNKFSFITNNQDLENLHEKRDQDFNSTGTKTVEN